MMRPPVKNCSFQKRAQQAGFTLVELMVALVISLFVLGAVLSIYLNMKNTLKTQDNLAQLQDSQRLALTMLTTTIQLSGYFVNPLSDTPSSALPAVTVTRADSTTSVFTASQAVVGSGDGSGSGGDSDTIAVRYQTASGDGLMNCQGASNASSVSAVSTNSFSINAGNELTCTVDNGSPIALAGSVAAMSILYGVDTDGDGSMDAYMPASGVTAAALWNAVYTAQISLRFLDTTSSKPGAVVLMPKPVVQTINFMNRQ